MDRRTMSSPADMPETIVQLSQLQELLSVRFRVY